MLLQLEEPWRYDFAELRTRGNRYKGCLQTVLLGHGVNRCSKADASAREDVQARRKWCRLLVVLAYTRTNALVSMQFHDAFECMRGKGLLRSNLVSIPTTRGEVSQLTLLLSMHDVISQGLLVYQNL